MSSKTPTGRPSHILKLCFAAYMCPDLELNPHTTWPIDLVNYKLKAVASFQCEPGYKLVGSKSSTCENISGRQQMGSWSHTAPVCQGNLNISKMIHEIHIIIYRHRK